MNKETKYKKIIILLSMVIPVVVALLFSVNLKRLGFDVEPLYELPPIYAAINGFTALVLIAAVIAIKNGKRKTHENLMKFAIVCSIVFLLMYVAYHSTSDSIKYGDINHDNTISEIENKAIENTKYIYYTLLISHIMLSIMIIPLVLTTYIRAWSELFDKHKKIAKITFPIWLYITITGVIIYLMISPYYPK